MKKILGIFAVLTLVFGFKSGPMNGGRNQANDIIGTFLNDEKDAKVRIFLAMNDKYSGKVEWMKEPNDKSGKPKLDFNNSDPEKRDRARLGLVILKNFKYDPGDNRWEGGTVYDPKTGNTYSGYMYFDSKSNDILHLRGYVLGMPFLGRTAAWHRVK